MPGFIKGYVRRFWQGNEDHRGTPERPGRVVTLLPRSEWELKFAHLDPHFETTSDICWGMVYKVADDKAEQVRAHLDHREKNGFTTISVDVYHHTYKAGIRQDEILVSDALLYVARTDNVCFIGPTGTIQDLARHIATTKGPSGLNRDYLFGLAQALRIISPSDDPDTHIYDLEKLIYDIEHEWITIEEMKGGIQPCDMMELQALVSMQVSKISE